MPKIACTSCRSAVARTSFADSRGVNTAATPAASECSSPATRPKLCAVELSSSTRSPAVGMRSIRVNRSTSAASDPGVRPITLGSPVDPELNWTSRWSVAARSPSRPHGELRAAQPAQRLDLRGREPVVHQHHLRPQRPQGEHHLDLGPARRHLHQDRRPVPDAETAEHLGLRGDGRADLVAVHDALVVHEVGQAAGVRLEQLVEQGPHSAAHQLSLQNSPIGMPTCRWSVAR